MSDEAAGLVEAWLDAARRPAVAADLVAVYAQAQLEIERRGPVCWASGRCCNFRKTGHLLYVTGLEAAYTVAQRGAPNADRLSEAVAAGTCPYQVLNRCGVHQDKPLGCRLYFCDRATVPWQHDLYERLLGELRSLHDRHGVPYRYGEWRGMMRMVAGGSLVGVWTPAEPADGTVPVTVNGGATGREGG